MLLRGLGVSIFAWLGMVLMAHAAPCAHPGALDVFPVLREAGPGADSGVQPSGFVDLKSGRPTVHGIDVSKLQDETDFETAYSCGARFAYVQISTGIDRSDHLYRLHWPNARAAGLIGGPLHGLRLASADALRWYGAQPGARPAILQALVAAAPAAGSAQADLFLARLDEVLSSEATQTAAGRTVLFAPIALDLTSDPLPTAAPAEKVQLGEVVAALACGFIDRVHANPKTATTQVILFAEPGTYAAYGLDRNTCGLERLPVWIAYHSADGGGYDAPGAAADRVVVDALCRPRGAADRCVFQQYTSAAGFAVFTPGAHLHLDRFFGSEADFRSRLQAYK